VVHSKTRTLVTLFGPVQIERTLYRDPHGKSHFLLDEALAWQPRVQATPDLQLLLAQLGTEFSYRQVQKILALQSNGEVARAAGRKERSRRTFPQESQQKAQDYLRRPWVQVLRTLTGQQGIC
jgi:hypothetical protein